MSGAFRPLHRSSGPLFLPQVTSGGSVDSIACPILGAGPRSAMTVSTVAVCCDDLGLMSDARRLCAAAGLEAEVVAEHDVRRWWAGAAAILLDAAAARLVAAQRVLRRGGVAVLTRTGEPDDWRIAVEVGAEQVVVVPADERTLLEGVLARPDRTGHAPVVVCVPASGGAGASTVAVGLAAASARRGVATLLIDGDPTGGGLDLAFGLEHAEGARWPDLIDAGGASLDAIPDGLLQVGPALRLLSWDRRVRSLPDLAGGWSIVLPAAGAGSDLVLVDLPRSSTTFEVTAADVVLLVVRAGVRHTVAAVQAASQLRAGCSDVRLIVRGAGRGLSASDVSSAVGLPLVAQLPHDRRIPSATDAGQLSRLLGRSHFDALATDLASLRRAAA
jgi:secretion/DNA translocation related CpaE-like protein